MAIFTGTVVVSGRILRRSYSPTSSLMVVRLVTKLFIRGLPFCASCLSSDD